MKIKSKNFNQSIFFLGALFLLFFGGGALAIVWLRMEITSVAKNCGQLEGEMEIVGREVNQLRGQRSNSLRPASLAIMVEGRLSMPIAKNTFHISKLDMNDRIGSENSRTYKLQGEFAGTR